MIRVDPGSIPGRCNHSHLRVMAVSPHNKSTVLQFPYVLVFRCIIIVYQQNTNNNKDFVCDKRLTQVLYYKNKNRPVL